MPFLRLGPWLIALSALGISLGYISWTRFATNPNVPQASVYPLGMLQHLVRQVSNAAPLPDWNIPWWSILVYFGWFPGVLAVGKIALRWLNINDAPAPISELLVLEFAAGFTVFAIAQLLFGFAGLLSIPLIPVTFVVFLISMLNAGNRLHYFEIGRAVVWQYKAQSPLVKTAFFLLITGLAFMVLPALTPPVQSDAVRYHIGAVQEYLKLGAISYIPFNAYSNMPFLVEMHYLAALASRAPEATQLMHFTVAVMTTVAIYALARRLNTSKSPYLDLIAATCALLYITMPMSVVLATWPFTDHGIAFFLIMSLITCLRLNATNQTGESLLFGMMLGALLGTKYTMAPIALMILCLPFALPGPLFRYKFQRVVIAGVAAAVVGGVWYAKNVWLTGNPFYPLASNLFAGGDWTPAADAFLQSRAASKDMGKGMVALLSSPWNVTFHWVDLKFESHNPGPIFLLSCVGAMIGTVGAWFTGCRKIAIVFLVGIVTYLVWFFSYQSNRLLLPVIAVMLSIVPAGFTVSSSRNAIRCFYGASMVCACFGLGWAIQWSFIATALTPPPLVYLTGQISEKSYRYQSLSYARAFDYLNTQVLPSEKVLLIGEHRIYGAKFSAIWNDWFDDPAFAKIIQRNKIGSTSEFLAFLRSKRITWIMINEKELERQLERDFYPRLSLLERSIYHDLISLKIADIKTVKLPPGVVIHHMTERTLP